VFTGHFERLFYDRELSRNYDREFRNLHPQDQQARIFERFVRIEQPEQNIVPGIGLGLYIAAQIVTHQGGQIWVESTPNEGATFFFTLPLAT
jgi:signal transduction histidine kinase